jgi:mRNA-degrading endonuclease toxin of MazEF toxin-antitoxin module
VSRRPSKNCDNLFTVPKQALGRRRGVLDPESSSRLRAALMIALDIED